MLTIVKENYNSDHAEGNAIVDVASCRRMLFVDRKPYFVSLPNMRFNIAYRFKPGTIDADSFFRTRGVKLGFLSKNNDILVPCLPNVACDLSMCVKSVKAKTALELVDNQIARVFISSFDTSEFWLYQYYKDIADRGGFYKNMHLYMENWQKRTKEDLHWIPENFEPYHRPGFVRIDFYSPHFLM